MAQERAYGVKFAPSFIRDLRKIRKDEQDDLLKEAQKLGANPHPTGCKPIKGRPGAYRIRVGCYRIVYEVHDQEVVVYVFAVGHRKDVYRL